MIDETTCYAIYELRNWSFWSRPMRLAITILPIVVFGMLMIRSFRKKRHPNYQFVLWRDLRFVLVLLIPWAFSQLVGLIYYTLCYSP